jgi:site-specific recombinase XerD
VPTTAQRRASPRIPTVASPDGDLGVLSRSFRRHLESGNLSKASIYVYLAGVRQFASFLHAQKMPLLVANVTREHVEEFVSDVLRRRTPATAFTYYRGVKSFFDWLVEDGEINSSPMARMKPPHIPESAPSMLTDDQLRKLLKTCEGNAFDQRRDMALLRLLIDSGLRLSEATYLGLDDVDLDNRVVRVLGKGSRVRVVPFGRKTAAALDRYLRERARHPHHLESAFWLGRMGLLHRGGVDQIVRRRAEQAGLDGTHAHLFRHGFAHTMKSSGMSTEDLMAIGGWRSYEMVARYGASAAAERAREAYQRRPSPGDRL